MLRTFTRFAIAIWLSIGTSQTLIAFSDDDPKKNNSSDARKLNHENSKSYEEIELEDELEKTMYNGSAKLFKLEHDDDEYGHAVWVYRKSGKLKSKYFASGSVYRNYENWKRDKHIFMACSGAFTNNNTPVGLTVDNGQIVNRLLEEDMGWIGHCLCYRRSCRF